MTAKTQPLKKPPQNIEAEKHVLGCALINPEHTNLVLDSLEEKDFFSESHRLIFVAMQQLKEQSKSIDSITVVGQLMETKKLESVRVDGMGGMEYIPYLSDNIPLSVNIDAWVQSILEKSQLRKLQEIGKGMLNRIGEETKFSDVFQYIENQVSRMAERVATLSPESRHSKPLERYNYHHFRHNRHFLNFAGVATDTIPLPFGRPESTRFPKTLPGVDNWFAAIQERTQAPYAQCANAGIAVMNAAVQHLGNIAIPCIRGKASHRPVSNFFVTIARSGERKSSVNSIAMQGVKSAELILEMEYNKKLAKYELEKYQYEREERLQEDGTLKAPPKPPKIPWLTVSDATADGIFSALRDGEFSQLMMTEEGGTLVGGYAMSKDHRRRTAGIFNQLWDASTLDRPRQGSRERVRDRRFSMHIMIQPKIAEDLVSDPLLVDMGLSARFLICEPDSLVSKRPLKEPSDRAVELCDEVAGHVERLILYVPRAKPQYEEEEGQPLIYNPTGDGLEPPVLYLNDDAFPLWKDFYNEVESELLGKYQSIVGFASKSAEHAIRLAAVFSLFTDATNRIIAKEMLQVGIDLARYYLAEQLRLQEARPTEEQENANLLLSWLRECWDEPFVSVADVCRGKRKLRKKDVAEQAIQCLLEYGHLDVHDQPEKIKGKVRRQVFRIVTTDEITNSGESGDSDLEA